MIAYLIFSPVIHFAEFSAGRFPTPIVGEAGYYKEPPWRSSCQGRSERYYNGWGNLCQQKAGGLPPQPWIQPVSTTDDLENTSMGVRCLRQQYWTSNAAFR